MRVLQVIHGYPPRYNAGSEIYTQTISRQLVRMGHEVAVFSREESPDRAEYDLRIETDLEERRIPVYLVNMPRTRERYRHESVDRRFEEVLEAVCPDVIHVGHLNHLSTSLIHVAKKRGLPIVFTLHDFWLMCPRGQFIQHNLEGPEAWALCDGQEDRKCAVQCYSRYFGGSSTEAEVDIRYWEDWTHRRMAHVREAASLVDLFIAPSRTVLAKFRADFGIDDKRIVYLDYGFDTVRLHGRARQAEGAFVFGYIGTHRPAKGIPVLLDAFACLEGDVLLRIWGRVVPDTTAALKEHADRLPSDAGGRVEWMGEYGTPTITADVFNRIDALVVPSIWPENSPLVIHEAQEARVPVITSNLGGMAEYVRHEENGLLFRPRDPVALADQMRRLAGDRELATRLGGRGYLNSPDGNIPSSEAHVAELVALYSRVRSRNG